uniref:NAC domain-containing protein n=1 Tax=Oryza brachyantha TaxID=4533 RepID=J3LQU7_ORYBR
MTEFAVDGDAADLVLCKLYRSPRAPRVEEATATASSSGSKRKSADDLTDAPVERSRPHWMKMNDHAADMVPAGADGDFHAKEEDRRIVPAPEEEALVQTRDGPRSDNDVIMALAMGATVDDLLGPQQAGEPSVSSYSSPCCPEPEPCPISSNAGGRPPFAAQAAPACGGDMSVATWAAPPAGEFSWEKELEWIQELLLGSPRVLARALL